MKPQKWLPGLPMPYSFIFLPWLLALVLVLGKALAQGASPPTKPMEVGQPVPEVVFTNVLHHPTGTARLSDFRGKLVLIDFWATWCGSCKLALPKLDALQQEFGDKVQVLLVNSLATGDTEAKVEKFFERWRRPDGSRYPLAAAVNDTTLNALFPHQLIPHIVWIAPNGTLHAITSADELTPDKVRAALRSPCRQTRKAN
jgi:thiol-disulfide isomerase/thioredoxin